MKKLTLSILAAGFAATSFAHGEGSGMHAGNILLYGVGSYSSNNGSTTSKFGTANSNSIDNDRIIKYQISPGVGINVTDRITVGVDFNYTGSKTKFDTKSLSLPAEDQIKTFDYGVGPFVRYSQPISEHFFAFGQVTGHYVKGRETIRTVMTGSKSFERDNDYRGFDASFVPAVGAMLTKSLGLTFSVGGLSYQHRNYDYSTQGLPAGSKLEEKQNEFNVSFGQQLNFGIQKYIGCGHGRHHRNSAEPMDETRRMDTSDDAPVEESGRKRKRNRKNDDE